MDAFRFYSPFWLILVPVAFAASVVAISPRRAAGGGFFERGRSEGSAASLSRSGCGAAAVSLCDWGCAW